jgi:hypothetical protein
VPEEPIRVGEENAQPPVAEPQALPESETPDESEYFIKLDKRSLQQDIARLEREDREFANTLNTLIGRKAASKWQPEVQIRENTIKDLRMQIRKAEILALPAEEIEQKFAADPAFAREYAEVVHAQPSVPDETPNIVRALNDSFDWARDNGVPEEVVASYIEKVKSAQYEPEGGQHWSTAVNRLNRDLFAELTKAKAPVVAAPVAATPPPPAPAPKVNNELAKGGPDLSHGASPAATKVTRESIKTMSREAVMEMMGTPEGKAALYAAQ